MSDSLIKSTFRNFQKRYETLRNFQKRPDLFERLAHQIDDVLRVGFGHDFSQLELGPRLG